MTKEELLQSYLEKDNEQKRLEREKEAILNELKAFNDHKEGDIVQWTETNRKQQIGGDRWNRIYKPLPDRVNRAVLYKIRVAVHILDGKPMLRMGNEFHPIKIDGGISKNITFPEGDYEWTGERYKDFG